MLEFLFGLMRTSQNSDALPINAMMYLVDKMENLQELMCKNGWVLGKDARGYNFSNFEQGSLNKTLLKFHMDDEAISDIEHLEIMNQAEKSVRLFFRHPLWSPKNQVPHFHAAVHLDARTCHTTSQLFPQH